MKGHLSLGMGTDAKWLLRVMSSAWGDHWGRQPSIHCMLWSRDFFALLPVTCALWWPRQLLRETASYAELDSAGGYKDQITALRFTCRLYNEEDRSTEPQVFIESKL